MLFFIGYVGIGYSLKLLFFGFGIIESNIFLIRSMISAKNGYKILYFCRKLLP